MRVLLQRDLYLEGVLYRAFPSGTEIPDEIGGKKVVLWDKAFEKKRLQRTHEMAEKGWSDIEMKEDEIVLPSTAVKYKPGGEAEKEAVKQAETLSQMHPPSPPSRPSEDKPDTGLKTTTRK